MPIRPLSHLDLRQLVESSSPAEQQRAPDEAPPSSIGAAFRPPGPRDDETRRRERLDRFAFLLDDAFRIPGTERRVGLDALIGLVPGIGDAAGALLSSYFLYEGARLGVSVATLLRMTLNIGIETGVGLVPVLGDLFDFAFKANDRNARLIERFLDDPESTHRSSRTVLTTVAVVLLLLMLALVVGIAWLVSALVGALSGAV